MTRFIRLAAVMMALLLAGCSHTTNRDDARPQAWLQPGTRVTLPPPGITPAIRAQQLLTGSFKGQTQSLLVMLNADGNKVTLAGLSSVGIRLFLATYDDPHRAVGCDAAAAARQPGAGRRDAEPLAAQRLAAAVAERLDAERY